jgi:octaprenyl-diphosphate synthase
MTDSASTQLNHAEDRVLSPLANASQRQGLDKVASNLSSLREWLSDDLETLEADLSNSVREQRTLSQKAAVHLLGSRGKRVRPLVTLLSSRMGGERPDEARHLAVACELVHAATLLHDDVLDLGTERRGETTARIVYGNSASVLGGDHLLIEALRRVRKAGNMELLDRVLEVIESMVVAEALQLDRRDQFQPSRSKYMDVAKGKTAVLFSWGMYAGGTVGGLASEDVDRLWRVGEHLGVAFQAVDDCLDLAPESATTGKDLFVDIREGKLTLPLILACEEDPALIDRLQHAAHGRDGEAMSSDELKALVDSIRETGCVEEARDEARKYSDGALKTLGELPPSEARDALATVIQAAVTRIA